jgi:hypothetical protein
VVRGLLIAIIRVVQRKRNSLNFASNELFELTLPSLARAGDQQEGEPVRYFIGVVGSGHRKLIVAPLEYPDLD